MRVSATTEYQLALPNKLLTLVPNHFAKLGIFLKQRFISPRIEKLPAVKEEDNIAHFDGG